MVEELFRFTVEVTTPQQLNYASLRSLSSTMRLVQSIKSLGRPTTFANVDLDGDGAVCSDCISLTKWGGYVRSRARFA